MSRNSKNKENIVDFSNINDLSDQNKIDYILVSKRSKVSNDNNRFEDELKSIGLNLIELKGNEEDRIISIHITKEILLQYCEILKLKMPLKMSTSEKVIKEQFSRNKYYLFDIHSADFIKPSEKYVIINYILEHNNMCSITKLIKNGVYEAAFPLHDEEKRKQLLDNWASFKKLFKPQPLDEIRDYFGFKIALYFYWVSFYNLMLFPASIIGLIYLLYGLCTLSNADEICSGNYTMCPQCDVVCDFWSIKDYCSYAQLTYIVDNWGSIFFTTIISVGCVVYLNLWNRWCAVLVHDWGVTDDHLLDYELPTYNNNQGSSEDKNSKLKKAPQIILSFTVVLFWLFIVIGVLLGLMFYRISLSTSNLLHGRSKSAIVAVTGSIFNLISILILNKIYENIAEWLTEREIHTTQKQYEESLMWKLYVFWFVNYYSSFFYIAFLKNRFIGNPSQYNRIFGYRQEECGPGNCLPDLFIQIAVVLIGDMTYNNIIEHRNSFSIKKIIKFMTSEKEDESNDAILNEDPVVRNCKLEVWNTTDIYKEHLELVLQYGMVTLFIAAFPLAPLFALINNIFELRLDAIKLLKLHRRPVPQNVRNIGIWITIMNFISQLAVITNGCIIAFNTNLIPHLIYKLHTDTNISFLDFSLSRFNTADLDISFKIHTNITECRYSDYRNSPDHENKYEISNIYWHILAGRLLFVLLFQNIVIVLKSFINWLVPEMPQALKKRIINDYKFTQRMIIENEKKGNK